MAKLSSGIFLENRLITSKAWLSLGNTAMQMYLIFRTKCQMEKLRGKDKGRWLIKNNGEIVFTYIEAKGKYGITSGRFDRGLTELVERGFIDISETGMGLYRATTLYSISEQWQLYGKPEFKKIKRKKSPNLKTGFKKGNTLGVNSKKKLSTVTDNNGSTVTHNNGHYLAMFTDNNGQRIKTIYNMNKNKWLGTEIA